MAFKRPQALAKPTTHALARYKSTLNVQDQELEKSLLYEDIPSNPAIVATDSSIHPVLGEVGAQEPEKDVDMMAGVKSDLTVIKETFSLEAVPKEAIAVGLAGVIPYLVTSLSTVYCAAEINANAIHGSGYLMSGQSADLLLQIIEPMQIGYGAVIISFLGAIHWGLEWAKYGGSQGFKRYAIGIVAPAIAWPTIMLSPIFALSTQFLAFTYLYYADSRASKRGWAPTWYPVYRFVLTFIVGASIIITLIGKGQIIEDHHSRLPNPVDRIRAFRDNYIDEASANEASNKEETIEKNKAIKEEE
ncbi:hypothetical protein EJ05DRAFT_480018 [Pseudovirgaria hyperparasitica]|uniref:Transmembrane protein 69 n=1 Tax=Pseudovirgaria hyperparasitica TaxID=470096 RepID=A0A6A6VWC5_9PEZI|nr:uncharacterized protein EJ05DRAFT_480018 [Pseudovirgaria hyperparasitica]KAF2754004.1 hypothetical protein EJ05DRAFT_480018 [Pseudovirgaria hyperparasitica]